MWRRVIWCLFPDVSRQPIGLIFDSRNVQEERRWKFTWHHAAETFLRNWQSISYSSFFFSFVDHSPSFSYARVPVIRPSLEPNKPRKNKSDYKSYCKMLSLRVVFSHEVFLSALLHRDVSTFSSVPTKLLSLTSIPNLSCKFCFSFSVVYE